MSKHRILRRPSSLGFTLMELLIVISIIAILASLLLSVISGVQEKGNSAKCTSNLRQIGTAMNLYANDHNNLYPPLIGANNINWDSAPIDPYLPVRGDKRQSVLFICPSAFYKGQVHSDLSRTYSATESMVSASGSWSDSMNRNLFTSGTSTLILFDALQSGTLRYSQEEVTWDNISNAADLKAGSKVSTYIDFRHHDAFHGLYADGHAGTIARADASNITKVMWKGREQ